MNGREYTDHLLRTSVTRVEHGRVSREISMAVLGSAERAIARSRAQMVESDQQRAGDVQADPPVELPAPAWESKPVADLMETVSGLTLVGEVVKLDGKHFIDCRFTDCTLEYSGFPVVLETTEFSGCGFRFSGQAECTYRFLECFGITPGRTPECELKTSWEEAGQRPN